MKHINNVGTYRYYTLIKVLPGP